MANQIDYGERLSMYLYATPLFKTAMRRSSNLRKLLDSIGDEFLEIRCAIEQLVEESNIDTADQLLPEWLDELGLPDDCVTEIPEAIEDRRNLIRQKQNAIRGATLPSLRQTAEDLGYVDAVFTEGTQGQALRFNFRFDRQFSRSASSFTIILTGSTRGPERDAELICLLEQQLPGHLRLDNQLS